MGGSVGRIGFVPGKSLAGDQGGDLPGASCRYLPLGASRAHAYSGTHARIRARNILRGDLGLALY